MYKYSVPCKCSSNRTIDEEPSLKDLLPVDYKYALCDLDKEGDNQFICRFRVNIESEDGARKWIEEFAKLSKTTYRVSSTFPKNTERIVYKVALRCHHNTRPSSHNVKKPHIKHTNCPARLTITVKAKCSSKNYKSADFHLEELPTVILLNHLHNHTMSDSLKYRNPNSSVKEIFITMFQNGYTPSKALHKYHADLRQQYGESYSTISSDGAICPNIQWVFYIYYQLFKKKKIKTEEIVPEDDTKTIEKIDIGCQTNKIKCDMYNEKKDYSVLNKFDNILQNIRKRAAENPDVLNAATKFVQNYERIQCDYNLISALQTFGELADFPEREKLIGMRKLCIKSEHGYSRSSDTIRSILLPEEKNPLDLTCHVTQKGNMVKKVLANNKLTIITHV